MVDTDTWRRNARRRGKPEIKEARKEEVRREGRCGLEEKEKELSKVEAKADVQKETAVDTKEYTGCVGK